MPNEFGKLGFQQDFKEPPWAHELCEPVRSLRLAGESGLGPGRQLPGWEEADMEL